MGLRMGAQGQRKSDNFMMITMWDSVDRSSRERVGGATTIKEGGERKAEVLTQKDHVYFPMKKPHTKTNN